MAEQKESISGQIRAKYEFVLRIAEEMDQADVAKGIDQDWEKFTSRKGKMNKRFIEAARALSRHFMVQGYLIGLEDSLGSESPQEHVTFRQLLERLIFINTDTYKWTSSPEAQLAEWKVVPGIGRGPVWH